MYADYLAAIVLANVLLGLAAYLPLAGGRLLVCVGALAGIGGIAAAVAHVAGTPLPLALVVGAAASAAAAWVLDLMTRKQSGFEYAITTLAAGEVIRAIVTNTDRLGGALGFSDTRQVTSLVPMWILGLLAVVCVQLFELSGARRAVAVLRESDRLAESLGVDARRMRTKLVVAAGALAGLSGAMQIHLVGIYEPRAFGFDRSMEILLYALAGGSVSYLGPVCGAAVLTVMPELLRINPATRQLGYGALLTLIMLSRPEGLATGPWSRPWLRSLVKRSLDTG
ncbi:MAG: branched-chain amino acid ABC transporter permease [Thermoanaerobaculia bacterium]